jgi:hypothetical protein
MCADVDLQDNQFIRTWNIVIDILANAGKEHIEFISNDFCIISFYSIDHKSIW